MSTLLARAIGSISSLLALIPQPLLPRGEGEQDFQVPLPVGEGFRVRAVRSLAKVTSSQEIAATPFGSEDYLSSSPPCYLIAASRSFIQLCQDF
jgi:hypothetical protein